MSQPWDRRKEENDLAWLAFSQWLMGGSPRPSDRGLPRVLQARVDSGELPPDTVVPSGRHISRLKVRHQWNERAAAYESFLMSKQVDAAGDLRRIMGEQGELERYRERLLKASQILMGLGVAMAQTATRCLRSLPDDETPTSALSTAVRTAASTMQVALDSEAAMLGLDDIIGTLSRAKTRDSDEDTGEE